MQCTVVCRDPSVQGASENDSCSMHRPLSLYFLYINSPECQEVLIGVVLCVLGGLNYKEVKYFPKVTRLVSYEPGCSDPRVCSLG